MKKHSENYRIYEVEQDFVNFLRGDDVYKKRSLTKIDRQVYSHYGLDKEHSDKYIGIIIKLQDRMYFAPITHDGVKSWFNRDDKYDCENIYNPTKKYLGSLLLCKGLPLTNNLVKFKRLKEIALTEGEKYSSLCEEELNYLNSPEIHDKIQDKMQACIYGKQSQCMNLRVNYELCWKNVQEYNEMLEKQKVQNQQQEQTITPQHKRSR